MVFPALRLPLAGGEMVLFDRSWYNRAASSVSWAFAAKKRCASFCTLVQSSSACLFVRESFSLNTGSR